MHAAAIDLRGGVSPRGTLLRGQSIIEYVLIIAVIGMVTVFAGPGVAGAIRNQFNLVTNTVNSGTSAGTEGGGASGGGSTGADSATVQAAIAKEAKDWTLDEQKAVAEDIAAKGEASPAYAKAKAAMDTGTTWSIKLTNGKTMVYRIIGINHDDLADGSGKAGLTLETVSCAFSEQRMNATDTNVGGWEKCELRGRLNTGDLWSLLPAELQSKVKAVTKMTDNRRDGVQSEPTATVDRLFLLSYTEIWGKYCSDGTQYEFYTDKGVTPDNYSGANSNGYHWTRSEATRDRYYSAFPDGASNNNSPASRYSIFPAFCF